MDVQEHPGFGWLGLYEQRLAELLVGTTRVEELLPDSDLLDLRAAVAVAAETRMAVQNRSAFGETREVLVVATRGCEIGNDPHSWSQTWANISGPLPADGMLGPTQLGRLISGGTPPGPKLAFPTIERRRVTFIDERTLSTSDYGRRWAEHGHDLVISDWPQVLARRNGNRYLFSAKLRSECELSWVIAPSVPERMQFALGEAGRYLLSLAPINPAQLRRGRPSYLALPLAHAAI